MRVKIDHPLLPAISGYRSLQLGIATLLTFFMLYLAITPAQAATDTFNCPGARGGLNSFPIQGVKWHDSNANQIQDDNEPGLPGFTIEAASDTASGIQVITRTLTNDKGEFCIGGKNLPDGVYAVKEVLNADQQMEWEQTYPAQGIHTVVVGPNLSISIRFGNKMKADLAIDKVRITEPVDYGQPISYTLTVTNLGPGLATGPITVTDVVTTSPLLTMPVSAVAPSPWSCTVLGGRVRCVHPGALPVNSSLPPITITATVVTSATLPHPPLENCATVLPATDKNPANNRDCDLIDVLQSPPKPPDLTLRKQISGTVNSPGSATFSVTVSNIGAGATTALISVTDTLPLYLTPTTVSAPAPWNCSISGQAVSCVHPGVLAAGNSLPTIVITANLASGIGRIANCAFVNTKGDAKPSNNQHCVEVIIKPGKPDLALRKAISTSLTAGGTGVFSITVKNFGSGATTGAITVSDTLIGALTPITVSAAPPWNCSISLPTVTCVHPGVLAAGATLPPIFITVNVKAGTTGFENCAQVATPGDGNLNNNGHCIGGQVTQAGKPDLAIAKLLDGEIGNGQPGFFLLTVSNVGSAAVTGLITVTDQLPAGLTPVTITASALWNCLISGQRVVCVDPGPLTAGASLPAIRIEVNVALQTGQNGVNCARVSRLGDSNPANNRSCVNIAADSDHDLTADGVECPNGVAVCADSDHDGLPDDLDDDDDGDGIPSAGEVTEEGTVIDSDGDGVADALDNCTLPSAGGTPCKRDVYVWKITPRSGSLVQQNADGTVRVGDCNACGLSISNIAIDEAGVRRTLGIALDLDLPGVGDDAADAAYSLLVEADLDGDAELETLSSLRLLGDGTVHAAVGGSQRLGVEVWKNGQLVGTVTVGTIAVAADEIGTLRGGGAQIRFRGLPTRPPGAVLIVHFGELFSFTPNTAMAAGGSAVLIGDELRIVPLGPVFAVTDSIERITVEGEAIDSFRLLGVGETGAKVFLPLIAR